MSGISLRARTLVAALATLLAACTPVALATVEPPTLKAAVILHADCTATLVTDAGEQRPPVSYVPQCGLIQTALYRTDVLLLDLLQTQRCVKVAIAWTCVGGVTLTSSSPLDGLRLGPDGVETSQGSSQRAADDRVLSVTLGARTDSVSCPPPDAPAGGAVEYWSPRLGEGIRVHLPPDGAQAVWRDVACEAQPAIAILRFAELLLPGSVSVPTAPDAPAAPDAPTAPAASSPSFEADLPVELRPQALDASAVTASAWLGHLPEPQDESLLSLPEGGLLVASEGAAPSTFHSEIGASPGNASAPPPTHAPRAPPVKDDAERARPRAPEPRVAQAPPEAARQNAGAKPAAVPAPGPSAGRFSPALSQPPVPFEPTDRVAVAVAAGAGLLLLLAALYHRVTQGRARLAGLRGTILQRLQDAGPAREHDLQAALQVDRTTVRYHLRLLVKAGAVARKARGRGAWFHVPGDGRTPEPAPRPRALPETAVDLARAVARRPGLGARVLAGEVGTSTQNAHYHLRRLVARGVLLEARTPGGTVYLARE